MQGEKTNKTSESRTIASAAGAMHTASAFPDVLTASPFMQMQRDKIASIQKKDKNQKLQPAQPNGSPNPAGPGVVQRHISWSVGNNQFEIDNTRPAWMGTVANMVTGATQSKNHIVPFAGIQNDLCELLNQYENVTNGANRQEVIDLSESLYHTHPAPDYGVMTGRRATILTDINNGNNGAYHAGSRALLSALNSSPDNVRVGGAVNNLRIGENLDADFVAGTINHNGNVINNGAVVAINQNVLTLQQASNDVIYHYFHQQEASAAIRGGFGLTFVISLLTGRQISSVTGPTAGGFFNNLPVLVTDPNGVNDPYLFQ